MAPLRVALHAQARELAQCRELEASLVSRECLGQRRVPSLVDLISLVAAWRRRAEEEHRIIEWRFRVDDARRVFRYEGLTTRRSEH